MAGCRRRFAVAARGRAARILAGFFSWLVLGGFAISASAHEGRPAALRDVAFEQRLNERLPLEIPFRDETGRAVRLGDYFGARPAVLALVYYRCEDLCPLTLDGLVRSLRALSFDAGREFDVVVISFDPRDTPALAAAKKEETVRRYGRDGASGGWHFLTGGRDAIARLTEAVGFRPTYETERDRYAHATGIVLATPEGRLSRYLYG
ncbi:MAG: SCO family protein, partial [Candidatus Binatia bacterium]